MPADPTYSYSSNPATDDKDAVRALLADTNFDGKGWMLSDEEILWAISTQGGQYQSAAFCAEMIAGRFAGPKRDIISLRIGDLQKQSGGRFGVTWLTMADVWRKRASMGAAPIAGGVELLDREDRTDGSLLQPEFVRGMDSYDPESRNDLDGRRLLP